MRFADYCGAVMLAGGAAAQQVPTDPNALARSLANPLAGSTTFSTEVRLTAGEGQGRQGLVNEFSMQRPFSLPQGWMVTTFTKLPVTITQGSDAFSGLGDLGFNAFLVTPPRNNLYLGVGLTSSMPAASRAGLGTRNWEAGPAAGIFFQNDLITTGMRLGQRWSLAGPSHNPRTSVSVLAARLSLGLGEAWNTGVSTESYYDWQSSGRFRWTVPVTAWLGRVFTFNDDFAMEMAGLVTHYALPGGPQRSVWEVGLNLTLVVPRGFLFR